MESIQCLTLQGECNAEDMKLVKMISKSYDKLKIIDVSGVENIWASMFIGFSKVNEIVLPSNIQIIPRGFCSECSSLKSIELPETLLEIQEEAFYRCESLTCVSIPKTTTTIGDKAFFLCSALEKFRLSSPIPPTVGKDVLSSTRVSFIEVPKGSMPFYLSSSWENGYHLGRCEISLMGYDINEKFIDPFEDDMVLIKADTFKQPINDYHPGWTEHFSDKRKKEIYHPAWTGSKTGQTRKVTITKDYKLCKYPVTQKQWESVMGNNPSLVIGDLPVVRITWDDTKKFIDKLNILTGKKYRLPTLAEWQMANLCSDRDGDNCLYKLNEYGSKIKKYAWIRANSEGKIHPVGQLKPNERGLYDMEGNVREWSSSQGDGCITSLDPVTDPNDIGRFENIHHCCGSSYRSDSPVGFEIERNEYAIAVGGSYSDYDLGFRLAISVDE